MNKTILFIIAIIFLNCQSMDLSKIRLVTEHSDEIKEKLTPSEIRILELASLAPSGHNTQPWLVKIEEPGVWLISINPACKLPAVDPMGRETLLSMGAFIENIYQAAIAPGYYAKIELLADKNQNNEIAQIILTQNNTELNEEIVKRIESRRTVKSNLKIEPILDDDINFITNSIKDSFHFYAQGTKESQIIDELEYKSNLKQAYREDAQEELADWIRWSDRDSLENRDGLNPDSFELTGIASCFVKNFYNRKSVLKENFKKYTMKKIVKMIKSHGGWLIITSDDSTPNSIIKTGRLFQQVFLRVRERNIALHPMTQPLEEKSFTTILIDELELEKTPQFILRLGYVDEYPEPKSLRKPIEKFIIF